MILSHSIMNTATHTTPETQLLLLCCRIYTNTISTEELTTFISTHKIQWHTIIPLALNHHLLPIAYQSLKKVARESQTDLIPSDIINELRYLYMRIVAQNVRLTESLHQISTILEKVKIPVLSIKGPVLASQAFGSISLRLFSDLDLIIPSKDILQAIDVLEADGFQMERPSTQTNRNAYLKTQQDWLLASDDKKIILDIKPSLISHTISSPALTKKLFLISKTVSGTDIRNLPAPNTEIMLLLVCMHGTHETWTKLSQVMDVCGLVQAGKIDWSMLFKTAQQWGQSRSLLMGLSICSELIGIVLPQEIRKKIDKDTKIQKLAQETITELLSAAHKFKPHSKDKWDMERKTRDSFIAKIRCGLRQILTPTSLDIEWAKLPHSLFFMYPLIRLARLAVSTTRYAR